MTNQSDAERLKQTIREAGGIVHSDGNIFFSNTEQFLKAARNPGAGLVPGVKMLLRRASSQLTRWHEKYGENDCQWTPPAGDVRLQENINELLSAAPDTPQPASQNEGDCTQCGGDCPKHCCQVYTSGFGSFGRGNPYHPAAQPASQAVQPVEPLTVAQRNQLFERAEKAMEKNPNLSWRHSLVIEVEAAHNIKPKETQP